MFIIKYIRLKIEKLYCFVNLPYSIQKRLAIVKIINPVTGNLKATITIPIKDKELLPHSKHFFLFIFLLS